MLRVHVHLFTSSLSVILRSAAVCNLLHATRLDHWFSQTDDNYQQPVWLPGPASIASSRLNKGLKTHAVLVS